MRTPVPGSRVLGLDRRVIRIVAGGVLTVICFLAGTGLLIAVLIWRPPRRA